ncbi:hypothetical protein Lepto7376_1362 [[Leptolyngbya] sp. PCC 7376]|uniref:hypothetical protein n=1 Tax=[Leptolyngbya] sp. PCC 7376 TaxID=111781 RepID=UPI00029F27AD|nr:hypothetical protein [[Leptolyngbya] sp. PCC 7376]AFY37714.1 hypothetical protein Lepto7376_1362 [[Leptolyngbya] sp. PCC 7376]
MKSEEIYQLAQQGNPRAIAEILKAELRNQGIRVMVKMPAEKHLKIIFEGAITPDQQKIEAQLQSLQSYWQKHLTLTITAVGCRFGELEPDWEWTIAKGLLSSEERQQSSADIAKIKKSPEAKQQRTDLARQLQKILAPHLWHSQITQTSNALVIKLNVIETVDRHHCRQVIQTSVQSLNADEIRKVYLNVYHRQQQKYLWKEVFAPQDAFNANIAIARSPQKQWRSPTKETIQAIAIGLGIGVAIFVIPFSRFILNTFLTFVHELGHAVAFWAFGYPAVPSFDFIFGGGITLALNQVGILVAVVYILLGYIAFLYRRNSRTLILLGGLAVLHLLCLISPWHQAAITMMGHVAEILAVFICGYFALGRYFCYVGGEQTMYAMLSGFSFLENCSFFGKLMFSDTFRITYRVGKGGLLDNDLVLLSNVHFPLGLEGTASLFFLCTIAMPILAWCTFRYEPLWIRGFYNLCQRYPESDLPTSR